VHANTAIEGRDRQRLERLCRYTARPPLAQDRVSVLDDGRVKYELKSTFKDGTQAVVMHPMNFMARLCALVPPPYFHMTRYQGVLAPHSSLRRKVVPGVDGIDPKLLKPVQLEMFEPDPALPEPRVARGTISAPDILRTASLGLVAKTGFRR